MDFQYDLMKIVAYFLWPPCICVICCSTGWPKKV